MADARDRWLYGWGLGYAAVGAASLLVPLYAIALGGDALLVGLLAATSALAGVPGAVLWGRLVARTHRRRVFLLVALVSVAAVLGAIPFVVSPWPLLVANALLWFVVAAAAPVLNLIVVTGVPESEWTRRLGLLNHYQGYGWLAGLAAGAAWTAVAVQVASPLYAQQLFFGALAATAVVAAGLTRWWYPDEPRLTLAEFARTYRRLRRRNGLALGRFGRSVPFGPGRVYWGLRSIRPAHLARLRQPGLGTYLGAVGVLFVGFFAFFGPLPAFLAGTTASNAEIFALYVLSSAGSAAFYVRAGSLASRGDVRRLQTGALVARAVLFLAVGAVGLVLLPPLSGVVLGATFVLIGVTWAVIAVTAVGLVTRLAAAHSRAEALGAFTAIGSLGSGIGAAVGGWSATAVGFLGTFALAGALVLAGAGLAWFAQADAAAGPEAAVAATGSGDSGAGPGTR